MALIACTACSANVSTEAAACPHCGHPVRTQPAADTSNEPTSGDKAKFLLILAGVTAFFLLLGRCTTDAEAPVVDSTAAVIPPASSAPLDRPVSDECSTTAKLMLGSGLLQRGSEDRSGLVLMTDARWTNVSTFEQGKLANCLSHAIAGSMDRHLKRIVFKNQRTGVIYGTLEYGQYRAGE